MGPLGRNSFSLKLFAEKKARGRAEQGLAARQMATGVAISPLGASRPEHRPDAKSKKPIAVYEADNPTPRLVTGETLEIRRDAAGLIRTMFSRDRGIAFEIVRDRAGKMVAIKTRPLKSSEGLH